MAGSDLGPVEEWLRRDHVARWWRDDIGEPVAEYRAALEGRDLVGPRVLTQFAHDVVFAAPETKALVVTVEEANRRSWRAFEKAGFRHVRDVEEDGAPHRLMRLDRPA